MRYLLKSRIINAIQKKDINIMRYKRNTELFLSLMGGEITNYSNTMERAKRQKKRDMILKAKGENYDD